MINLILLYKRLDRPSFLFPPETIPLPGTGPNLTKSKRLLISFASKRLIEKHELCVTKMPFLVCVPVVLTHVNDVGF